MTWDFAINLFSCFSCEVVSSCLNQFIELYNNFFDENTWSSDKFNFALTFLTTLNENFRLITPIHVKVLRHSLCKKDYKSVFNIVTFKYSGANSLSLQDALSFFYYSGLIFIGNKMFKQAQICFIICVTWPGKQSLSWISIEAYKKYCLLVPLVGKFRYLKCDPYIFQKTEAYHRFAQNWGHLFDNQMKLVFKQDKNFNLAQRAVKEATLYSVYHVVRIFNTIYLSELCRMCDKDEETITQILSELTNRGFINAEIDKKKDNSYFTFSSRQKV